eukprot:TRINITY_DN1456_c2_g1_i1.p1 TRINITY_DN1456_c2_g1~~TRINITY_DN1456_c2_g1_i1.p1  ORF type:complete len:430 (-),score=87.42 TRINITY_DN1456_c2_g1_i1:52-1341(-)
MMEPTTLTTPKDNLKTESIERRRSNASDALPQSALSLGRYELLTPIGHGAYGVVFTAKDTITTESVAVKKVLNVFGDPKETKRTLREIKILRHMKASPYVVKLREIMTPKARDFKDIHLVMDLHESDLAHILDDVKLTPTQTKILMYQLLLGLKHLHQANIIHRDLRPRNLLVNGFGPPKTVAEKLASPKGSPSSRKGSLVGSFCKRADGTVLELKPIEDSAPPPQRIPRLYICDFGMGRAAGIRLSMLDCTTTRWYRAPEGFFGINDYSAAVDIWSAGCIFAEMFGFKNFLKGKSESDQLKLLFEFFGEIPPEIVEHTKRKDVRNLAAQFTNHDRVSFASALPGIEPAAVDLLEKMMQVDGKLRISAADALKHPYFDGVEEEMGIQVENQVEVQLEPFGFAQEDGDEDDVKEALIQELMLYNNAPNFS